MLLKFILYTARPELSLDFFEYITGVDSSLPALVSCPLENWTVTRFCVKSLGYAVSPMSVTLPFLVIEICSVYTPALTKMTFGWLSAGIAAIAAVMLGYSPVPGLEFTVYVGTADDEVDVAV